MYSDVATESQSFELKENAAIVNSFNDVTMLSFLHTVKFKPVENHPYRISLISKFPHC